jgi:acyl-CoA synthetase (AMP-forming)/AMP-acid ligase II
VTTAPATTAPATTGPATTGPTSPASVLARDLVPAATRRAWAARGWYADEDLYTLFARHTARDPHRAAVIDADGETDYAELDLTVRRLACGLGALGVGRGDVVGIQVYNGRLACALDLALAAIGAVALPYPVGRGDRDILSLLRRSGAVAAVVATSYGDYPAAQRTLELASSIGTLRAVVAVGPNPPAGTVPVELLLSCDATHFRPSWPDPDGPARILVSSGSEAEPKMVLYSHNALTGGRGRLVGGLRLPGHELRMFFLTPLGSAFGGHATPATLAANGATLVLQPRFDPLASLRMIERARPTHLMAVPTMLRRMLEVPEAGSADLSSLEVAVLGGAPLDQDTARRIAGRFGCTVVNLYGSADGVNSHTALDAPIDQVTTAGRPNPAVAEIRVVDEQLKLVPAGTVGEVIALGPTTPMGYVGAPELDARYRLDGGWVRTGDLGRFDENGVLTIVGRRKEVVIRGGLNISPAEVEAVLLTHPAITDAVCVGVPDPVYGERLAACVAGPEEMTLDALRGHLAAQGLEQRKWPERLLVLPALRVGPAGKVDRHVLSDLLAAEQDTRDEHGH